MPTIRAFLLFGLVPVYITHIPQDHFTETIIPLHDGPSANGETLSDMRRCIAYVGNINKTQQNCAHNVLDTLYSPVVSNVPWTSIH